MVRRRGIGATLASGIIFSIILLSNFGAYAASQERERAYIQSNMEDAFYDQGIAVEGAATINALVKVQAFLTSTFLSCQNAIAETNTEVHSMAESYDSGDLSSRSTYRLVGEGPSRDNLTLAAPFAGSVPGDLNIAMAFQINGGDPGYAVSYMKTETHYAHLPVRMAAAVGDCLSTVSRIQASVGGTVATNCTADALAPLVAAAAKGPKANASADGFELAVTFTLVDLSVCTVFLRVSVIQPAVIGPEGVFNMELQGGTFASFEQQPKQQA